MNLKIYEKTRYQNIYRNKKNKNYIIQITEPKTTISSIGGNKIYKLEEALKIRDNPKITQQKKAELAFRGGFDELWDKYINYCQFELKLSYMTQKKKNLMFNKHLRGKMPPVSKISKEFLAKYINSLDISNKQKNELIDKILKPFFKYCLDNEYIIKNPISTIKKYKCIKEEMKYWLPENVKTFFDYTNKILDIKKDETVYRIKMLVLLTFTLGDRVGETRALTFGSIKGNTVMIKNSINYHPSGNDFVTFTKTRSSVRDIEVSDKVIEEINKYRNYLTNDLEYNITDDTLIFFNHKNNKPYTDTALRKQFYKVCECANVPKIRLYDLRHTYTVIALAYDDIDMWAVSHRLGHTDIKTTLRNYNHIVDKTRKEMAQSTDKYL